MTNDFPSASYDNWKTTPPDESEPYPPCPDCHEHKCQCEENANAAFDYECIGSQADAPPPPSAEERHLEDIQAELSAHVDRVRC
jgi:hypothetical protein